MKQSVDNEISLLIGEEVLKVKVRFSTRARRMSVRVNHDGIAELALPRRQSLASAREFLLCHLSWIKEKISLAKSVKWPCGAVEPEHVMIFGEPHKIEYMAGRNAFVSIKEKTLVVSCALKKKHVIIQEYLKAIFLDEVMRLAREIGSEHGLIYKSIRLNNSKTALGLCSADKKIAFCWRLVFAKKEIVRYVVVHELCHLKEMNHSKKFWSLVQSIDPWYQVHRAWLKNNIALLGLAARSLEQL